jgi:spermidine/putrescine-binding protein
MKDLKSEINRRRFLGSSLAVAAPAITSSYFLSTPSRAQGVRTINMLAWYGHAEPDVVAAFEAQNNCKIKAKYYTGGDNMLALIAQSPVGTYDLILSDAEYVPQLQSAGYIERLDPKDYPFDDFSPSSRSSPATGKATSCIPSSPVSASWVWPTTPIPCRRPKPVRTRCTGIPPTRARWATSTGTCQAWARSASSTATQRPSN